MVSALQFLNLGPWRAGQQMDLQTFQNNQLHNRHNHGFFQVIGLMLIFQLPVALQIVYSFETQSKYPYKQLKAHM